MFTSDKYDLIIEAIKNDDLSFRISENGLMTPGERAARATINRMMEIMQEQRQDIEMASWEKLTRILTHEIMNSLAPIVSLSDTFMKEPAIQKSEYFEGIKAIHDTSEGLRSFVDSYRKFSSLQRPQPEDIIVDELFAGISSMVDADVHLTSHIQPSDIIIHADPGLMRQLFMNLVKNAIEAHATHINLSAYKYNDGSTHIIVSNDGSPIPEAEQKDIFVPFFTTKKTGNGIGLSLCRQIMKISGGSITLLPTGTNGWNVSFEMEII
ncbi:MAG: HAMP domain-containing histidine kinase [Bacteroidaceae bacterium]|nr:HAMP domain-containing histidine kinase [Bacteroidaceae bacterium]